MASGNSRDFFDDSETRTPSDQHLEKLIDNIADNITAKVRQSVEDAKGQPILWNPDENDHEEVINQIVNNTMRREGTLHSQTQIQSSSYAMVSGVSRYRYNEFGRIPQGDREVEKLINTITGAAKKKVRQQVHAVIQQEMSVCSCGQITYNYECLMAKIGAVIRKAIHTLIEIRELLAYH